MHKLRLVIAVTVVALLMPSVLMSAVAKKNKSAAHTMTAASTKTAASADPANFNQEEVLKKLWTAPDNTVIAVVNGLPITKGELMRTLWDWNAPATLDEMINQKMINQAAQKAHVSVTHDDMLQRVDETKKRMPGEFNQVLRQYNLTKSRFWAGTKTSLVAEKTVQKQIKTTDAEFAQFIKASHILIRFPQGESDKAKAEQQALEKAKKVYQEVKAGKDFAAAAKEYSDDPSNKDKGGELGWFKKGRMVKEFEDKAFSMKPGEISEPVKTFYGYHIIKLEKLGKDATAAEKQELAAQIRKQELPMLMQKWYTDLKASAKIENKINPPLPAPPVAAMPAGHPGVAPSAPRTAPAPRVAPAPKTAPAPTPPPVPTPPPAPAPAPQQ